MRRVVWVMGWTAVAVWSLFAFAAYGLVDLFGGLAARHADVVGGEPETVEWLSWFFRSLRDLGTTLILVVWGFVALCILSVPWMLSRIVTTAAPGGRPPVGRRPQQGVIDLPADQYAVVKPRDPAPQGPPPFLGPSAER